jgi:hypothetical protein
MRERLHQNRGKRCHSNWPHSVNSCDHKTVLLVRQLLELGVIEYRDFSDDPDDHGHTHARSYVEFGRAPSPFFL